MQMISNWTFISILFGISYISFIIWNRLIRVRLPKELFITNEYDLTFFIVFLLTVIFGILFIYYLLKLIKYLPREPGRIIKKFIIMEERVNKYQIYIIVQQVKKAFMEGPLYLYLFLYNQTRLVHVGTEKIGIHLFNIFTDYKKLPYLVYIIMIVFPRLIVSMVLVIEVIEVIYLRELNLFYEVLPLLLLPLIIKGYFGILQSHSESIMKSYEKYFSFYYDKETQIFHITVKNLTDPKEIEIQEGWLKKEEESGPYFQYAWDFYYNMLSGLYRIFIINIYERYKTILFTIYYMLYFIGFLFYLLILIGVY
jgi:hypothetical protein